MRVKLGFLGVRLWPLQMAKNPVQFLGAHMFWRGKFFVFKTARDLIAWVAIIRANFALECFGQAASQLLPFLAAWQKAAVLTELWVLMSKKRMYCAGFIFSMLATAQSELSALQLHLFAQVASAKRVNSSTQLFPVDRYRFRDTLCSCWTFGTKTAEKMKRHRRASADPILLWWNQSENQGTWPDQCSNVTASRKFDTVAEKDLPQACPFLYSNPSTPAQTRDLCQEAYWCYGKSLALVHWSIVLSCYPFSDLSEYLPISVTK